MYDKFDSDFIGGSSGSRNKLAWSGCGRMSGFGSTDVVKSTKFRLWERCGDYDKVSDWRFDATNSGGIGITGDDVAFEITSESGSRLRS